MSRGGVMDWCPKCTANFRFGSCPSCGFVVEDSRTTDPRIVETTYGKFLALSPKGSVLGIGVIGDTEEDARSKFAASIERWTEILARPHPHPIPKSPDRGRAFTCLGCGEFAWTDQMEEAKDIGFREGWDLAHESAACGHARANWKDPKFGTPEYEGEERCEFCDSLADRIIEEEE